MRKILHKNKKLKSSYDTLISMKTSTSIGQIDEMTTYLMHDPTLCWDHIYYHTKCNICGANIIKTQVLFDDFCYDHRDLQLSSFAMYIRIFNP